MLRSIVAVVIGFLFIGALSAAGDAVIRASAPAAFSPAGATSDPAVLIAVMVMVGVFAVAGCYLTARLAQRRPMLHALVLGVAGLVFNIVGTVANWALYPAWFLLVSLLLVMPFAWLGGRLRELELARQERRAVQGATAQMAH